MDKKPFFSVIIPTYNRSKFLKIAVRSVLEQSLPDYELIIVDDGSNDNTKKLFSNIDDKRIRYIQQKHQGVSSARNNGIEKAKGEFVCFLDSDDRFRHDKLKTTYEYIEKYPQYKVFHTEEVWYRKGELLSQKIYHKKPNGLVFKDAVRICCIGTSTVAINKNIFKEIGIFDKSMPACEDYDFWLRVTHKYPVFLIPEYLTIKEGGRPDQLSFKYPAMDRFRIYALRKILESGCLNTENHLTALNALKDKCNIYIKGAQKRGKNKEIELYKQILKRFEAKNA